MGNNAYVEEWLALIKAQSPSDTGRIAKRKASETIDPIDVKRISRQRRKSNRLSEPPVTRRASPPFSEEQMPPSPAKPSRPAKPLPATDPFPPTMPIPPVTPAPSTPSTNRSKSGSLHPSSSASVALRQTENNDNVRASLAYQGMFFEHEEAYDSYPDLQHKIKEIVFQDRGSAMRQESLKSTQQWRAENATKDERTYFAGLLPRIIKDARGSTATTKRSFEGEVFFQSRGFDSDGLDRRQEPDFVKGILPQKVKGAEKALGLSNPRPDYCFGLKRPRHPLPTASQLPNEVQALIGVAPGLHHPFFVIENKGCEDSIETAENQAIRSGATLVAAQRQLHSKVRVPVSSEPEGADPDCFAFSCSWVPQMANLHVHWYEQQDSYNMGVYHMNLLRGYLMSDRAHMAAFRRDIHNILDWGVSTERKVSLEKLIAMIARGDTESAGSPLNEPARSRIKTSCMREGSGLQ